MYFISQKDEEGMKLAIEENKEIKKANDEYEYLTGEEAERRIAFLIEKARKDEVTMREGYREEGIEIGRKENKIEIAKNMLKEGMDINLIAKITKLPREEIEKLSKKLN